MKYTTILADPPWRYDNATRRGSAENHYPTMSLREIADLPIKEQVADNAHLYLWITNPFLLDGRSVIDAWGFRYVGCVTWVKGDRQFTVFDEPPDPRIGTGTYFRSATEHLLFSVRGKLPLLNHRTPTWFMTPPLRHSAKPEESYRMIEACSPGPYLELFARRKRPGWHHWGNEIESDVAL